MLPPDTEVRSELMSKTIISAEFGISEAMRSWAEKSVPQVNIDKEHESFVDYWLAHGTKMADWPATWRNWMRRAPKMGGALFSPQEMEMRALMRDYTAQGFRRPFVNETAFLYRQAFEATKIRDLPKRDMSSVLALVGAKRMKQ